LLHDAKYDFAIIVGVMIKNGTYISNLFFDKFLIAARMHVMKLPGNSVLVYEHPSVKSVN